MKYKYTLLPLANSEALNDATDGIVEDDGPGVEAREDSPRNSTEGSEGEEEDGDWLKNIKIRETKLLDKKEKSKHEFKNKLLFPYKVFYIIGSEFCERFSFYGLKAVLVLYLSSELLLGEDSATSLFHGWTFLCYFTPVLGAFLADSLLGRFKTILYLSTVYLTGNVVLSLASTAPLVPTVQAKTIISTIGLILIAFGTGGIKPCVSAFGGDQFDLPQQEQQLSKFFSVFYFSINAGALLSTLLTPILREDVSCFGGQCFPLAFGVPAILMFLALVLFVVGFPLYKIIPPEGNISAKVIKCVTYAGYKKIKTVATKISNWRSSTYGISEAETSSSHWLHLAADRFPSSLIEDVKALLAVLVLYIPLPVFWALYDQQGSRWTFQATRLSGSFGSWTIKPDQMQVLNPILIMILIPFFQGIVYPLLARLNLLTKSLDRMILGGILASLAFVVSGILQLTIEDLSTKGIPQGKFSLTVLNALPCPLEMEITSAHYLEESHSVPSLDMLLKLYDKQQFEDPRPNRTDASAVIRTSVSPMDSRCSTLVNKGSTIIVPINEKTKELNLAVTSYLGNVEIVQIPQTKDDYVNTPTFRVIDSTDFLRISPIFLREEEKTIKIKSKFFSKGISWSKAKPIPEGRYEVVLPSLSTGGNETVLGSIATSSSSVLFLYTLPSLTQSLKSMKTFNTFIPGVHMMWLLPQYVLISVAEIMFSISGLEFSFKQAPASMKSVVQASWLLTTAFGDLMVVVIAKSKIFSKQSFEYFLFAALMVVDMIVFYCFSRRFDRISKENQEDIPRGENIPIKDIPKEESPPTEDKNGPESPFTEEDSQKSRKKGIDNECYYSSESDTPEDLRYKDSSF